MTSFHINEVEGEIELRIKEGKETVMILTFDRYVKALNFAMETRHELKIQGYKWISIFQNVIHCNRRVYH